MCGIVGYVGQGDTINILLEGLKRLEYRGYDSAGIGIIHKKKIKVFKKEGRIDHLIPFIPPNLDASCGIAHTRWATHGEVNDANAHPHFSHDRKVAIIHNGIIDNYLEIKKQLLLEGCSFQSETDSEVIANLIAYSLTQADNPELAVNQALQKLQGTYGLLIILADQPGLIIGARCGSPLVMGIGENRMYLASDPNALIRYTNQVIYLSDGETVFVNPAGFTTTNYNCQPVQKKVESIEWQAEEAELGEFSTFMLKEIFEQPASVRRAYGEGGRLLPEFGNARLGGLNLCTRDLLDIKQIKWFAMGTGYYSAMIGAYLVETLARIPSTVEDAAELRYKNPIVAKDTLYLAVSQSGETLDTIAAMREIQIKGGIVLGLTNVAGSTIARETNGGVFIHAGPEIAVASTKTFSAHITVMLLIALLLGRTRDISLKQGKQIIDELTAVPDKIRQILAQKQQIQSIAAKYADKKCFLFVSRGINYPVALEGALKLKEISYLYAEGFTAANLKHGPIALINENVPVLVIAVKGETYEKTIGNIEEIKARKGKVIVITNQADDQQLNKIADDLIIIPQCEEYVSPLLTIVPLQLFAYYVAQQLGCDIDKPRNLAKTVTVE